MPGFLRDLLLPQTDLGVLIQVAVVLPAWLLLMFLVRRHRELLLVVFGLGLLGGGLAALRAVH